MINQQELKRLLSYAPDTGVFAWAAGAGEKRAGNTAGWSNANGYRYIDINNKKYLAHRLAFLYVEGYFPEHDVDHMNGERDDNRWNNLRHVTMSCNLQNQKKHENNSSGFTGVTWDKHWQKWRSQIGMKGKQVYLGLYSDKLEAALVRYTFEVWCVQWSCNHRSQLTRSIQEVFPEFRPEV